VGRGDVDWIGLAQDRDKWRALVNSVLNIRVLYNAGKLSSVQTTRDLSSSAQLHRVNYVIGLYLQTPVYGIISFIRGGLKNRSVESPSPTRRLSH
jgi:hypothetical protein